MTPTDLLPLLGLDESERIEFKRGALGVKELGEYAVGIGNSGGGVLVLGVTDKLPREVHGLSPDAVDLVTRARQPVLNSTRVRIDVRAVEVGGKVVLLVDIPARPRGSVFHTADGKYLMRVGESLVGMPESEIERIKREEAVALDLLAEPVPGPWRDLVSLVELERLRAMLRENHREELAKLSDEALLSALELFLDEGGHRALTRVGVLLVGTPEAIRRYVPYHELKLLRFGADELDPVANFDHRVSLVHCLELAEAFVAPVNTVESVLSGLFRVDIPRFPRVAWREALVNAFAHRDYAGGGGAVALRIYEDRLEVGSPGGWYGGVSDETVLRAEPRRRNELLAAVLQKLGVAERSAVGIRRMFRAMLLAGKAPPRFRSTPGSVTVALPSGTADRAFSRLVAGPWGEDRSLGVIDLLALSELHRCGPLTLAELAPVLQCTPAEAGDTLRTLGVAGLVRARGKRYALGPEAMRRLQEGPRADVVPPEVGFVERLVAELGRAGAAGLAPAQLRGWTTLGKDQLTRVLTRLVADGTIVHSGRRGVGSRYWLPEHAPGEESP